LLVLRGRLHRRGLGTQKQQSYPFDAFGNLQAIAGTSGRGTPTSSQTNRLSGAVIYDAAGNLTAWNGATYAYDAFNQMVQMTSGAENCSAIMLPPPVSIPGILVRHQRERRPTWEKQCKRPRLWASSSGTT
jgi:hypothetical protein